MPIRGVDVIGQGLQQGISGFMGNFATYLQKKRLKEEQDQALQELMQLQQGLPAQTQTFAQPGRWAAPKDETNIPVERPRQASPMDGNRQFPVGSLDTQTDLQFPEYRQQQNWAQTTNPAIPGRDIFTAANADALMRAGPQAIALLKELQNRTQLLQGYRGQINAITQDPSGNVMGVKEIMAREPPVSPKPEEYLLGQVNKRGPEGQDNSLMVYGPAGQAPWDQKKEPNIPPWLNVTRTQSVNWGQPFAPKSGGGGSGPNGKVNVKMHTFDPKSNSVVIREVTAPAQQASKDLWMQKSKIEKMLLPYTQRSTGNSLDLDAVLNGDFSSAFGIIDELGDGSPEADRLAAMVKAYHANSLEESRVNVLGGGFGDPSKIENNGTDQTNRSSVKPKW